MKTITALFIAFRFCSFLSAQDKYAETFENNKGVYSWEETRDYVIKDGVYQITSAKGGTGYLNVPFPYFPFAYEEGQDWTLEMSMKKIAGGITAQWGIEISEFGKLPKMNLWMDNTGAYGMFGHMEFKIRKGFNDMKLVKTGDTLDVYFNDKLMGSGSIEARPEGHFSFSVSESSVPVIVQFDNIKFEITRKEQKPVAVAAEDDWQQHWEDEYLENQAAATGVFSDCYSYNIITHPGHSDCLKRLEGKGFTYLYHPLWRQSQNENGTTTFFEIISGHAIKVGDTYREMPAEFNNSLPLFDTYQYFRFENSIGRYNNTSYTAKLDEIKSWGHDPQEFDFINSAGVKGKILMVNYLHDGTGLWRYAMYAVLPAADGFIYSMMNFGCAPKNDILSGVRTEDEATFRQWATAYFSGMREK